MSVSFTLKSTLTYNGTGDSSTTTITADEVLNGSVTVPASQTDYAMSSIQFPYAKVQGCYIKAVGGNITIKTNSVGSPGCTINLTDGEALVFGPPGSSNPFTGANVTSWHIVNANTSTVALQWTIGVNN